MKRQLTLIAPGQELQGVAPPVLERAAKGCRPGDATHRGLVFLNATLARRAVAACVSPTAREELLGGLETAENWARERAPESEVRSARARCFAATPLVERKTVEAVEAAAKFLGPQRKTRIDAHATRVVRRHTALAAHYACSAVVLTLDGIGRPADHAMVPNQVCGAHAYRASGLGAARHGEFRAKAWEQAEWELAREGAAEDHSVEALALQIFHEYLGVRWKTHADLEAVTQGEFIEWALSGRPSY